jgi:hypothetical protein
VRWSWKIGGDVQAPPPCPDGMSSSRTTKTCSTPCAAGTATWPGAPPSLAAALGPILYGDGVLVACFGSRPGETFLIGFDPRTGQRQGDLKAPGEVRTPR